MVDRPRRHRPLRRNSPFPSSTPPHSWPHSAAQVSSKKGLGAHMPTDTIPENPTQLADMLGSGEFRAELLSDPAKMGKFISSYADAFAKKDSEFTKEFQEMAQQELRN